MNLGSAELSEFADQGTIVTRAVTSADCWNGLLFTDVTPYRALDKLAVRWAEYGAVHGGEPFWREAATLDLAQAAREAGFVDVRSEGLKGAIYPWVTYGHKPG